MKLAAFFLLLLNLATALPNSLAGAAAEDWRGRRLSAVLEELRAAGLPLLYSSQVVNEQVIAQDQSGAPPLVRLRRVLQTFDLELRSLPAGAGYAVVRAVSATVSVRQSTPLQEVTVFASRYDVVRAPAQDNAIYLPQASLEKTAGIEQDTLRAVQYLPGTSSNGLSALSHVRGGYVEENLTRFDGVELYKPVHLKDFQGLFGLLDPDWVQSFNFYSGAYPVRFGNHTAAVIDIEPRNVEQPQYLLGASLLYSRLFSAGSYDDAAGHWLLGYRRSNIPLVARHAESRIGDPEFEDLLLRHSYRFGDSEIKVGALRLNDDLALRADDGSERAGAQDHDSYLWAGWQQPWSAAWISHVQFTHTQFSSKRNADLQFPELVTASLLDHHVTRMQALDAQLDWRPNEQSHVQVGVHGNYARARYRYASVANYAVPLNTAFAQPAMALRDYAQQFNEVDYAGYLSGARQLGAWHVELGLRYDVFPYLPHGTQFSPRVNLQYALAPGSVLHLSAGRYTQAATLDALDVAAATPQWYAPQRQQQYIIGWTRQLPHLQLRIEAYAKRGSRTAPQPENFLSVITLAGELELDRRYVDATHARAQGVEVSLSAPAQRDLGWWLNYSWSRVQDEIAGAQVPRSWDQPHAATAGVNWTRGRWLLAGSATWHTGWPYTPLLIDADSGLTVGARNSQRFKDFASLELRAQYQVPVRGAQLQLFAELRNALNRDNLCCRELQVSRVAGGPVYSLNNEAGVPLLPIVGFNLKF